MFSCCMEKDFMIGRILWSVASSCGSKALELWQNKIKIIRLLSFKSLWINRRGLSGSVGNCGFRLLASFAYQLRNSLTTIKKKKKSIFFMHKRFEMTLNMFRMFSFLHIWHQEVLSVFQTCWCVPSLKRPHHFLILQNSLDISNFNSFLMT